MSRWSTPPLINRIRYYLDPQTGRPHMESHGVFDDEVQEILDGPDEERRGRGGAMEASGQTRAGRYLRVIYVLEPQGIFVLTAYELRGSALTSFRRRRRRRWQR